MDDSSSGLTWVPSFAAFRWELNWESNAKGGISSPRVSLHVVVVSLLITEYNRQPTPLIRQLDLKNAKEDDARPLNG